MHLLKKELNMGAELEQFYRQFSKVTPKSSVKDAEGGNNSGARERETAETWRQSNSLRGPHRREVKREN